MSVDGDVDIEYINHAQGPHAFDLLGDTPRSRGIIRRTLDFLGETLSDEPKPS